MAEGARANTGDFEALLEPLLDPLFGTALRLSRNRADAEDVLQETVMKAWRGFDGFQPGTNFKAWVFKILANTFVSRKRSEGRGPRVSDLDGQGEAALAALEVSPEAIASIAANGSVEEGLDSPDWERVYPRLVDDDLKRALDELPEEYRAPLLLSSLAGLSYKEIAGALEIPIGTVMSRLFRARERVRRSLTGPPLGCSGRKGA